MWLTIGLTIAIVAGVSTSAVADVLPTVESIGAAMAGDDFTVALLNGDADRLTKGVTVTPAATVVPAGRFGAGIALTPQTKLTLTLAGGFNPSAVTARAHFKAAPTAETATLWSMQKINSGKKTVVWELLRQADGHLLVKIGDKRAVRSSAPLPADQWHHVAVSLRKDPGGLTEVRLSLDGHDVGREWLDGTQTLGGTAWVIGAESSPALAGIYDDIELSRVFRRTYAVENDPRSDPQAARPVRRGSRWFRDPQALVYAADFNGSLKPEVGEEPGTGQPSFAPGLRGQALLLGGESSPGGVTLPLPAGIDFQQAGVIDFWVQPVDWDNHETDISTNDDTDKVVSLLEIIGRDPGGSSRVIASFSVDRTRESFGELPDFRPGKWTHVALPWSKGAIRPQFDHKYVFPGSFRGIQIDAKAIKQCKPTAIRLVSGKMRTRVDELSVYRSALSSTDSENAFHRFDPDLAPAPELSIHAEGVLNRPEARVSATLNTPQYASAAELRVRAFVKDQPGRPLAEAKAKISDQSGAVSLTLELPTTLDDGEYLVEATMVDAAGKTLANASVPVEKYTPDWHKTAAGRITRVPSPWTELKVDGAQVGCWSTIYRVSSSGWLESAVVRGQEILQSPVRLEVQTDDGPVEFRVNGAAPKAGSPTSVQWRGEGKSPVLDYTLDCAMDFDGMIRHELTLIPHGKAAVRQVALEIPLQDKRMPLHHAISIGSEGSSAGLLAAGENRIWDSVSAYAGKNPATPPPTPEMAPNPAKRWKNPMAVGSFFPMLWIGSDERGLSWFADNDAGWIPTNAAPAVELIRRGEALILRLNFIAEPAVIDSPRTITFGLLPTPTKPAPPDARAWHRGGTKEDSTIASIGGAFDSQIGRIVGLPFGIFPARGWDYAQHAAAVMKRQHKTRILYMSAYWMGERMEAWYKHSWEWEGTNGGRAFFTPSYVDYLAGEFKNWFGRDILDGVYIDEVYPTWSGRTSAGGAYTLPGGKTQVSTSIFHERQFIKRLYGLSVENQKRPLIIIHMTGTMVPALTSFGTVTLDGEGHWIKKGGKDFMDLWPLDRFRAMQLGAGGGNVSLWIPMVADDATMRKTEPAWIRSATRTMIAEVLLHDTWFMFDRCDSDFIYRFTGPALRSFDIAEPDLRFTGYWSEKPLARAEDPNVLISSYHNGSKALLIVSNFGQEAKTAKVTIAVDQLGKPLAASDLEARYAENRKGNSPSFTAAAPPKLEGQALTVEIGPRDYRLIAFEPQAP